MEYHRISIGKVNKFLQRLAAYKNAQNWWESLVDKIIWKFGKKAFCPKCNTLTKWTVGAIQLKVFKGSDPKYVIGFSHTCLKCGLQIRKGIDKASDKEIAGMFEKDLMSKV